MLLFFIIGIVCLEANIIEKLEVLHEKASRFFNNYAYVFLLMRKHLSFYHAALCLGFFILTACTIMPKPMSVTEKYQEAKKNVAQLFNHDIGPSTLSYEEAMARGIRYNYDYR